MRVCLTSHRFSHKVSNTGDGDMMQGSKRGYFLIGSVILFALLVCTLTHSLAAPMPSIGKVTLMELGSDWCMPCKLMRPTLEKLQKNFPKDLKVMIVDVSKDKEAAEFYRIRMIPTQIFFGRDGKEYKRHTGYLPEKEILKILQEMDVRE